MVSERVYTLSFSERLVEIVVHGVQGEEDLRPISGWSIGGGDCRVPDVRLEVWLQDRAELLPEAKRDIPVNTVESIAQPGGGFRYYSPGALEGALVPVDGQLSGSFRVLNGGRALEGLLKIAVSQLFCHLGGVLFHSSAVSHSGTCFLFLGPSGAGKTTIATRLNAGGTPISLDRVGVLPREGGGWAAYATPFSDLSGAGTYTGPPVPVRGLVFIHQAEAIQLFPLEPLTTLKNILKHIAAYGRSRESDQQLLDVAERMATEIECCELHFTKDERFWSVLDRSRKESL